MPNFDAHNSTVATLLRAASDIFAQAPVCSPTPKLDARILLMYAADKNEGDLIAQADELIPSARVKIFEDMVARRILREPIAYIIGYRDFWKSRFKVTPDVLIPRPDSEILIETALKLRPPAQKDVMNILDLGVGSGCLLGSLLAEYSHSNGIGVDASFEAAKIALENLQINAISTRAMVVMGHWLDAICGPFDLIIANPPYIAQEDYKELEPEIRNFEPRSALVSPESGQADYEMILSNCLDKIASKGLILLEIGDGQAGFLDRLSQKLFKDCAINIHKDLAGLERCLSIDLAIKK